MFTDSGRQIYMQRTSPRRYAARERGRLDIRNVPFSRPLGQITTIVLHQTNSGARYASDLPDVARDSDPRSYHRVDEIIAHLIVLSDGVIAYTHDVQYSLNDAGAGRGIDIEMVGHFSTARVPPQGAGARPTVQQLVAGRSLVRHLATVIPSIQYIHPHGQIETPREDGSLHKTNSCCGPDFWVNIGEWAVQYLGLIADQAPGYRHNHGISDAQRNPAYRRAELAEPPPIRELDDECTR